jgi:hypothetical protein
MAFPDFALLHASSQLRRSRPPISHAERMAQLLARPMEITFYRSLVS